jgi:transposase
MGACCGGHHLGRLLKAQGHEVRLMSPEYVRPYVKAQKNDDRDAEAIAEAATRPTMRFVALKSGATGHADAASRPRSAGRERTALINQLRAILLERGTVVAQGRRNLERELDAMLGEGNGLKVSQRLHMLIEDMREEWRVLDRRITALDDEFAARAKNDETARRLATIPGIGVLNATALAAALGEGQTFARGRDLAASASCPGRSRRAASPVSPGSPSAAIARLTQAADPRRQGCSPGAFQERDAPGRMVARASGEDAQERRCRRLGQQARPHRLGRVAASRDVQSQRDGACMME